MNNKFTSSRSDDSGAVKDKILEYLSPDPSKPTITLPKPTQKEEQGFHYLDTGRALCPQRLLPRFNDDPERYVFFYQTALLISLESWHLSATDRRRFLWSPPNILLFATMKRLSSSTRTIQTSTILK